MRAPPPSSAFPRGTSPHVYSYHIVSATPPLVKPSPAETWGLIRRQRLRDRLHQSLFDCFDPDSFERKIVRKNANVKPLVRVWADWHHDNHRMVMAHVGYGSHAEFVAHRREVIFLPGGGGVMEFHCTICRRGGRGEDIAGSSCGGRCRGTVHVSAHTSTVRVTYAWKELFLVLNFLR